LTAKTFAEDPSQENTHCGSGPESSQKIVLSASS
jgi:hypothetical protein